MVTGREVLIRQENVEEWHRVGVTTGAQDHRREHPKDQASQSLPTVPFFFFGDLQQQQQPPHDGRHRPHWKRKEWDTHPHPDPRRAHRTRRPDSNPPERRRTSRATRTCAASTTSTDMDHASALRNNPNQAR